MHRVIVASWRYRAGGKGRRIASIARRGDDSEGARPPRSAGSRKPRSGHAGSRWPLTAERGIAEMAGRSSAHLALSTIESSFLRAKTRQPRLAGCGGDALCVVLSPLAPDARVSHLSVGSQLDTRLQRMQFLFPVSQDWEHPGLLFPVSHTVEGAGYQMGVSERSPPRTKSFGRNPLALRSRT